MALATSRKTSSYKAPVSTASTAYKEPTSITSTVSSSRPSGSSTPGTNPPNKVDTTLKEDKASNKVLDVFQTKSLQHLVCYLFK
ncbi:hypothetical protein [Anaerocolumna xylanovorans]|uniref:Uncharacterized protein n=1 Tax=Anaerocolumna xylanovorans DSM 12503 TaxID=1121345 RepID=A0A1M7YH45_9FIRM|nr:hypothetical protein [Anaerocolumna xylanovorans]SHO51838.1 hypothetical protein SAMN02745217_03364 [Anaerocolumna xylanovorans DSM 12503]